MKNILLKSGATLAAFAVVILPAIVFALGTNQTVAKIENPLKQQSLTALLADILNIVVQIGVPVVTIMIIFAGFKYVTAGGDERQVEQAHSTFLWTVVGAAIVLGAFVIANIIKTTAGAIID